MNKLLLLSALATTIIVASARFTMGTPPPYINRPTIPPQDRYRFRREANPNPQNRGSISATVNKPMSGPERRPTYNIDYQHNIWQNKNGQISAGGGAQRLPGHRWEPTIGVQGTWRFKREAHPEKHGSFSSSMNKPLSGPERRPTYNIDYQHNIWQSKNGQISAGGGAQRLPGRKWEPTVGVQGTWRFKREANPQHGSISIMQSKPLAGPERRPSYKLDYQHNIWQGKNGQISAGGGAQKLPGQRWEPQVGIQGTYRFPG
ncbi:uncharacterized protein LOC131663504 [Phymastichus coffea]|uniref:uncharacterized protein LOC131663504 n=1 Tax=Phymastichus coffea TaxID=108790 RepID=UPI00273BEF6F|nr:uncharacterized protein LOC131663504 [Phymastichus coffea]